MAKYSEIGKMKVSFNFTVARDDENNCYRFFVSEEEGKSLHIAQVPIFDENGNERDFNSMVQTMREQYKFLLLQYMDFTSNEDYAEESDDCENCSSCGGNCNC